MMKVARIYLRVSADDQDMKRQSAVVESARANGYYIAGVYSEKASGARPDRPELLRMVEDLQPGDVVVAERIDRISRLPLPEAELLVASIRAKGARLSVPVWWICPTSRPSPKAWPRSFSSRFNRCC